jgi:transposase
MIKEVYHSHEKVFELRKYVSSYIDLVKMGVRLKNQRSGFLSQEGKSKTMSDKVELDSTSFVIDLQQEQINLYEVQKDKHEELFKKLCKENKILKRLFSIPGIGEISAVKILSMIVDVRRFPNVSKYLTYCGLVSHIMESGGKVYGRRRPRY